MSKWAWCLVNNNDTLATGWNQVGDYWYYMKANGSMATGWIQVNTKWYYLNDKGQMQTGWYQDTDKNKWYYLYEATDASKAEYTGVMAVSCTKILPDGKKYTFDTNGALVEIPNLLSDKGADFIGSWEGLWLKAEYDPCYPGVDKYITIGYGTTKESRPDAVPNGVDSTCTIEQARQWLIEEGQEKSDAIKSDLDSRNITLNQNELDALISFAYNCGAGSLLSSTLYKNIINGVRGTEIITSNFLAWNKANGKAEPGLTRRRNSEAALFLNADYTGNN